MRVRGVRARSARILIISLKYLRTTRITHEIENILIKNTTLEHECFEQVYFKMHLQYTEKFKSKVELRLNPYVEFEKTRDSKNQHIIHQQVPIERDRTRLSLHGNRPKLVVSKSPSTMICSSNVSSISTIFNRERQNLSGRIVLT